jgi:hypothetical protein
MNEESLLTILAEEGLPATTPIYQYRGIRQCLESFELEIERYGKDGQCPGYVMFTHLDGRSFLECVEDAGEKLLARSYKGYDLISHTIVLKMPSPPHATATATFVEIFILWYTQQHDLLTPGGDQQVPGSTTTKEKSPDASWMPPTIPPDLAGIRDPKWPTVVVETAWSERKPKLKQDLKFWVGQAKGQVRVLLTIKIRQRDGKITIKRWLPIELTMLPGPLYTQKMTIKRDTPEGSVKGLLEIPFREAYLREKCDGETDFHMSHEDMRRIGELVWARMLPPQ